MDISNKEEVMFIWKIILKNCVNVQIIMEWKL